MPKPRFWDRHPALTSMHLICDVHDVLFDWFLREKPRHLCLHGAAVRIGDGLVCFPSVQKAGKSILCIALAACGQIVFCDDVLPIEPRADRGFAMGIAPRLRRPLPETIGSRLLHFIAERAGPADSHWVYAKLRDCELAPLGSTAPIKAFILLRRGAPRARLEIVAKSEMLKEILLQNFAKQVPPVETLDRLKRLIERAECYRLHYGNVSGAARLLARKFTGPRERVKRAAPSGRHAEFLHEIGQGRQIPGRFRRVAGIEAREVGDEIFLAAPNAGTIHHLDHMASAAWRILARPKSAAELIDLFRAAFPDQPRPKIAKDLTNLLAFLSERGLIAPTDIGPQRRKARVAYDESRKSRTKARSASGRERGQVWRATR